MVEYNVEHIAEDALEKDDADAVRKRRRKRGEIEGQAKNGGDYEIGKGKPPKEHQFRKGENWKGNRYGRPKGSLNHSTMVRKVFGKKTPLVDPETGRKLTGAEAYYMTVRNDSLKSKPHAARLVDGWLQKLSEGEEEKQANRLSPNHQEIIEKALQRLAERQKKQDKDV